MVNFVKKNDFIVIHTILEHIYLLINVGVKRVVNFEVFL